jgi:hypothetical protein
MPERATRPAEDRRRKPRQSSVHLEELFEFNRAHRLTLEQVLADLQTPDVPREHIAQRVQVLIQGIPDWYAAWRAFTEALVRELDELREVQDGPRLLNELPWAELRVLTTNQEEAVRCPKT